MVLATAGTTVRAAQWRDARALFLDTLERTPTHRVAAELGIRFVLLPDNRFAEARAAAGGVLVPGPRRYLATDPRHWHAAYNLARVLWARGDLEGAREALREARRRAVATGSSTRALDEVEAAMARD